jgi:hypothetical protein
MTYTKIDGICLTPKQLSIVRTFCEPKWGQQDNVWYFGRRWYFATGGTEGRFLGIFV